MTDTTTDTDTETETDAGIDADSTEPTTRTAVVAGPDDDALGAALADRGMGIEYIDGIANRDALEHAGIADCSLFVLTDARQATAIPVAKDVNPTLKVVVYARDSLPEFARGQADLLVDPALLEPATVAEELAT